MTQTWFGKRTWSLGLVAARVLLSLEALGLMGLAVAFAYFPARHRPSCGERHPRHGHSLAGRVDRPCPDWRRLDRRGRASGADFRQSEMGVLWTARRRAAARPRLRFGADPGSPAAGPLGLETETEIGRAIVLLFVLLPRSDCLLLLFRAEVREHFGL